MKLTDLDVNHDYLTAAGLAQDALFACTSLGGAYTRQDSQTCTVYEEPLDEDGPTSNTSGTHTWIDGQTLGPKGLYLQFDSRDAVLTEGFPPGMYVDGVFRTWWFSKHGMGWSDHEKTLVADPTGNASQHADITQVLFYLPAEAAGWADCQVIMKNEVPIGALVFTVGFAANFNLPEAVVGGGNLKASVWDDYYNEKGLASVHSFLPSYVVDDDDVNASSDMEVVDSRTNEDGTEVDVHVPENNNPFTPSKGLTPNWFDSLTLDKAKTLGGYAAGLVLSIKLIKSFRKPK